MKFYTWGSCWPPLTTARCTQNKTHVHGCTVKEKLIVIYTSVQMVFMGRGFTSGRQESGSVFSAAVCYRLGKHYAESLPLVLRGKSNCFSQGPLYGCLLIMPFETIYTSTAISQTVAIYTDQFCIDKSCWSHPKISSSMYIASSKMHDTE